MMFGEKRIAMALRCLVFPLFVLASAPASADCPLKLSVDGATLNGDQHQALCDLDSVLFRMAEGRQLQVSREAAPDASAWELKLGGVELPDRANGILTVRQGATIHEQTVVPDIDTYTVRLPADPVKVPARLAFTVLRDNRNTASEYTPPESSIDQIIITIVP